MGSNGSAPDGIVPAIIRSLPAASRKNDRSRLPSAARGMVAGGDDRDDAKSAAVFTNNVSFWTTSSGVQSDKAICTDASSTNCWWDKSKSQPSVNAKGLVVTAADFASSLSSPPAFFLCVVVGCLVL